MYVTKNYLNNDLYREYVPRKKDEPAVNTPVQNLPAENKHKKTNYPVLAATAVGTLASLLLIRKYQGKSLKNDLIKLSGSNGIMKNLNAIRKNIVSFFSIETGLKEMVILGAGSILGGLAGGVVLDKNQHTKSKVKEGVYQFINIVVPACLVEGLLKFAKKYKSNNEINRNKIINGLLEKYTEVGDAAVKNKILMDINKKFNLKNNFAHLGAAFVGIGLGMPIASVIANKINNADTKGEHKYKRKMKLADSIMHADDIVGALILAKIPFVGKLGLDKLFPLLHLSCGYETGKQK